MFFKVNPSSRIRATFGKFSLSHFPVSAVGAGSRPPVKRVSANRPCRSSIKSRQSSPLKPPNCSNVSALSGTPPTPSSPPCFRDCGIEFKESRPRISPFYQSTGLRRRALVCSPSRSAPCSHARPRGLVQSKETSRLRPCSAYPAVSAPCNSEDNILSLF